MEFTEIAIVAGLVATYALVAGRLDRSPITAPMVFCLGGLVLGSDATGLVELHVDDATVGLVAEITLVLVLFSDAARIDVRQLRTNSSLPLRLLAIGFPLTVAAGLGAALLVFPALSVWEAGLLAVILTPTDAALGQAVVSSPAVPNRIRQALNVESGLNDGLAVPLLAIMLAGALGDGSGDSSFWARFIGEQIGYGLSIGLLCGFGGGYLVRVAMDRGWMNHTYGQIAPLSIAVLAFAAASALDGNGFLAAFVAGIAFGTCSDMVERVIEFAEEEGQLLAALSFFLFGAVVAAPAFRELDWRVAVYAAISLTVVRVLPVGVAMAGSGLERSSIAFVGWFGPRGLASIIFAIEVAEHSGDLAGGELVASAVTCAVLLSIVAHGMTAAPLSTRYGRHADSMSDDSPEMMDCPDLPLRKRTESPQG